MANTNDSIPVVSPQIQIFNWREIRLTRQPLNSQMLDGDGFLCLINCNLLQDNTHQELAKKRLVKFDRKYVQQAIAKLLSPIIFDVVVNSDSNIYDFHDLQWLAKRAITDFCNICIDEVEKSDKDKNKLAKCLKLYKDSNVE